VVGGERHVVTLVRRRHPHARFLPVVQHDLLGDAHAEDVLEELAQSRDVRREQVQMIEATDVHAAGRETHRLILERRFSSAGALYHSVS
jgi:hypothetical protein